MAARFPFGRRSVQMEETRFRLADYRAFLADNRDSIAHFERTRQDAPSTRERADWERADEFARAQALVEDDAPTAPGRRHRRAAGHGTRRGAAERHLWKPLVQVGDRVQKGTPIVSIEAMKMQCE